MTDNTKPKGAITEAIEALETGISYVKYALSVDQKYAAQSDLNKLKQALTKLQELKEGVKKIDEAHKDHKWFKHGDDMTSYLHSECILHEIEGDKAKLLQQATED